MYIIGWFSWGSPVGIGVFLVGLGVFFWGLLSGVAKLNKVKKLPERQ